MEFVVLGWPPDAPRLRLDYRRFAYAGKFVDGSHGKAVVRDPDAALPPLDDDDRPFAGDWDDDVLAAVSFSEDRTDPGTLWLRYITVRLDRRGEGLGPRLALFLATRADARGYDRLSIAVNNPFAFEAMYRAGFAFTGRETGLAELVLERPADGPAPREPAAYRRGLDVFGDRELDDPERRFLARRDDAAPPPPDDPPD